MPVIIDLVVYYSCVILFLYSIGLTFSKKRAKLAPLQNYFKLKYNVKILTPNNINIKRKYLTADLFSLNDVYKDIANNTIGTIIK